MSKSSSMLRTQTMNQSESHVSVCVWFWPHVNEPIVQEEHGASRASTKINLTEKSPVVRMATERAVGLQTTPQQDSLCVCVFMWWHSSQSCPCGLWCGRVPLLNLIRVFAYIMAKRNRKKRGRLEEVKESSISVIIFKRLFWWFDMVNFAKSYL